VAVVVQPKTHLPVELADSVVEAKETSVKAMVKMVVVLLEQPTLAVVLVVDAAVNSLEVRVLLSLSTLIQ
jgi:hypothetical protein